ncbi:MAG: phosphoesterase PA-phosphatase related protein [Gemmatimonadetes bacterium]|nr:phosphoesterase PA-phosphatase related protein [Gemmatimonadota bacterium]
MKARALLVALCTATQALHAQGGEPVLTHRDLVGMGIATLGSVALFTIDRRVALAFGDSSRRARHPGFEVAAKRASIVTETVLMGAGGLTWGVARLSHDRGTADVALHATESVLSAAMAIQVVRGVLGRERPYVADSLGKAPDSHPWRFHLLKGFTHFSDRSYPSMHAMASFAAATALTQEMRVRNTPHRAAIGPLLYVGAAAPSLARLYLDEHWTSDIAMGIYLGILSGQKVVQYSHAHPDNRVDRRLLARRTAITVTRDVRGFSLSLGSL